MKQNYFAIIPANVRYDQDLTTNAKLLYGEITAIINLRGFIEVQDQYFSKLYGNSDSTIAKWIGQLKDLGFIEVEKISGKGQVITRRLTLGGQKKVSNEIPGPIAVSSSLFQKLEINKKKKTQFRNSDIKKEGVIDLIFKNEIDAGLDLMEYAHRVERWSDIRGNTTLRTFAGWQATIVNFMAEDKRKGKLVTLNPKDNLFKDYQEL